MLGGKSLGYFRAERVISRSLLRWLRGSRYARSLDNFSKMKSSLAALVVKFIRVSIFDWNGAIYYQMKDKLINVEIGP